MDKATGSQAVVLHPVLHEYKETYWNLDLDNVRATDIILQVEYEDGTTEELKA